MKKVDILKMLGLYAMSAASATESFKSFTESISGKSNVHHTNLTKAQEKKKG